MLMIVLSEVRLICCFCCSEAVWILNRSFWDHKRHFQENERRTTKIERVKFLILSSYQSIKSVCSAECVTSCLSKHPSALSVLSVPDKVNQPHIVMAPPPCFTGHFMVKNKAYTLKE